MNLKINEQIKFYWPSILVIITQASIAGRLLLIDSVFSKKLSLSEFGTWKEMFIFLNILVTVLALGIPEGFKYFIAKEKKVSGYFSNLLVFLLTIAALSFLVIGIINIMHFFGLVNIKNFYLTSLLFPLAFLTFTLNLSLRYVYINENKINIHTKIILYFIPVSILLLLAFYFYLDIFKGYYLYFGLITYSIIFGLPLLFLIKKLKLQIKLKPVDKVFIKNMLHQGIPLYLATFVGLLCFNIDKIIVSYFESKEVFAVFAAGAFEIPVFAMFSAAFSNNDYPKLVANIEANNREEAKNIWFKTTRNVSYFMFPMILVMMIFAKEIITIVYSKHYSESVFYFQTYLLLGLFRNNFYSALIAASGNAKKVIQYTIVLLILNVLISISLYKTIGLKGIVFGTLISTTIFSALQLQHEKILKRYIIEIIGNKIIFVLITLIIVSYFYF